MALSVFVSWKAYISASQTSMRVCNPWFHAERMPLTFHDTNFIISGSDSLAGWKKSVEPPHYPPDLEVLRKPVNADDTATAAHAKRENHRATLASTCEISQVSKSLDKHNASFFPQCLRIWDTSIRCKCTNKVSERSLLSHNCFGKSIQNGDSLPNKATPCPSKVTHWETLVTRNETLVIRSETDFEGITYLCTSNRLQRVWTKIYQPSEKRKDLNYGYFLSSETSEES